MVSTSRLPGFPAPRLPGTRDRRIRLDARASLWGAFWGMRKPGTGVLVRPSPKSAVSTPIFLGCGRRDSNPHGVTMRCLRPLRLPFRHVRERDMRSLRSSISLGEHGGPVPEADRATNDERAVRPALAWCRLGGVGAEDGIRTRDLLLGKSPALGAVPGMAVFSIPWAFLLSPPRPFPGQLSCRRRVDNRHRLRGAPGGPTSHHRARVAPVYPVAPPPRTSRASSAPAAATSHCTASDENPEGATVPGLRARPSRRPGATGRWRW